MTIYCIEVQHEKVKFYMLFNYVLFFIEKLEKKKKQKIKIYYIKQISLHQNKIQLFFCFLT